MYVPRGAVHMTSTPKYKKGEQVIGNGSSLVLAAVARVGIACGTFWLTEFETADGTPLTRELPIPNAG